MRIAFCVHGVTEAALLRTEFYRQDRELLGRLGHEVEFVDRPWRLSRRFDLAYVWWWNYLWLWGPVARGLGLPVLATGVFDAWVYETLSFPRRWLKGWGCGFSDLNVFVSREETDRVPRLVRLKKDSVRYGPLGVDTSLYRPAESRPEEPFTLLNVCWQRRGNLERKMVPELLEAFAALQRDDPSARLILAGPPEDGGAWLKGRAGELGVGAAVSFPGEIPREEKIRLMQECSLYCQVSQYEGFGLATAEAMACGAPVLVSRVGAVPEVVGECGFYVDVPSVEGILQALRRCRAARREREEKGAAGACRIREQFSFDRRREDLRRFLDEIGGGR